MTLPINPDVEVLQHPPLTCSQRFEAFERAVAEYATTRTVLREVSVELGQFQGPKPEDLRNSLRAAAVDDDAAKRTILAQAIILMAYGDLERAREALDIETAGRP